MRDFLSSLWTGLHTRRSPALLFSQKRFARPFAGVAILSAFLTFALAPVIARTAIATEEQKPSTIVFAAASLQPALNLIGEEWLKESGQPVVFSFGASSALARQIENGAPADIFMSADLEWMDWAQSRNLLRPGARQNLLGNRLVLIAPQDSKTDLKIAPDFPLAQAIGDSRLATGDPKSVPVGKYAKASLTTLNVWPQVEPLIAATDNVRAALALVAKGEAKFGIVYKTDAMSEPRVRFVDAFPDNTHPPIIYPAALTLSSSNPNAAAFYAFLTSGKAKKIFEKEGFTILH